MGARRPADTAGGGKDPQCGGAFPAGSPAFSVIRTVAWYTPFAALCAAVPAPTGRTAQRSAFQAVPALEARWSTAERAKTMAANFVRCPRDRGESVKGGHPPPFHKSTMTNRNSPPRAAGAQGSFDCRREAPGGPRTGPQLQAGLRPKAIPDQGPVRGPLDPDCRVGFATGC